MPDIWYIDGYNLLHGLNARRKNRETVTRESLFGRLADFAETEGSELVLVLDGKGPDAELAGFTTKFFHVVYSDKLSADSFIERALFERRGQRLFVVTGDTAIRRIARGGGASVYSPDEFIEVIEDRSKKNSEKLSKENIRGLGFNRPFDGKLKDKNDR